MKDSILPSNWMNVRVKEVVHIVYGKALQAEIRNKEGSIPVYGSGGVIGKHNKSLHEGPSIIIGRKGNVGAIYYVNEPFWCIDTAFYLDEISEAVDIDFLAYALEVAELAQFVKSVAVPGIGRDDIENTQIPLPPLPEQRRIVAILREADEIRKLRQQANDKMQKIIESLFYDMFGDCSPYKEYSEGWEILPLSKVISDTQYGLSESLNDEGEIGVLRMGNITTEGWLDLNDLKFSSFNVPDINKYDLRSGDILFNRTNSKELVGKTGIWEEMDGAFTFASYIIRVRVNGNVVLPEYIWGLLNSPYGKQQLFAISKQAVNMANINTQELGSIRAVIPPLPLQMRFAMYVRSIRDQIKLISIHLEELNTLYQSLLTQAFSGELTASWREAHLTELAQAAEERDLLLKGLHAAVNIPVVLESEPGQEFQRVELTKALTSVQEALLAVVGDNRDTYFTATRVHDDILLYNASEHVRREEEDRLRGPYMLFADLDCSLDTVRRELHFLASMGLIKGLTLPAEEESGSGFMQYVTAYRSLRAEDDCQQLDLAALNTDLAREALV